jgi:hypothetical protein
MATTSDEFDWQPFIGRALGFLCLDLAEMRSRSVLDQAEFLMKFGLPRREAAVIVGSTDDSLRVLARNKVKKSTLKKVD